MISITSWLSGRRPPFAPAFYVLVLLTSISYFSAGAHAQGKFQTAVSYPTGTNSVSIAVGDFNRDGKSDIAVANSGSNNVSVLLGNGDGTFQAAVNYAVGTSPSSVAVGDFNSDGKLDLVLSNSLSNNVSVLLGNGDGSFQAAVSYSVGTTPQSVAVGDLNGDGKLDLVTSNLLSANVSILLGNGDGTFQVVQNVAVGASPVSLVLTDLNGDDKPDLVETNSSSNNASVFLNSGGTNATVTSKTMGQNVSFTATIERTLGTNTPGGTVQFQDGGANLGSPTAVTGSSGVSTAVLSTSSLSAGNHIITALYSGDANFWINTAPQISIAVTSGVILTSPNGGERWAAGITHMITWTYTGMPDPLVKIDLLKQGRWYTTISSATAVGSAGAGSFNWTIPMALPAGSDYSIQVASTTDTTVTDTSDAAFIVPTGATITVTAPNGGQSWIAGTTQTINWTYTGEPGSTVEIDLLKQGRFYTTISYGTAMGSAGSGSFNWTIPTVLPPGNDYRVQVTSTSDVTTTDTSDGNFGVQGGTITVTSPNGGEIWLQGTSQTITWTYTGNPGPTVEIDLLGSGNSYSITSSAPVGSAGSGEDIVTARLRGIDVSLERTDFAYYLVSDTRGKGVGSCVKYFLITEAFAVRGLSEICGDAC